MTINPFNDDLFAFSDGVEQVNLTSGGPWRAIVRRITRSEQQSTGLTDDTVVFDIEPMADVNIGDTVTRSDESSFTILRAQKRSHDTRWVVFTQSGTPSTPVTSVTRLLSIVMADADTEYSLDLGLTKSLTVNCRDALANLRIALEPGKVASLVEPYHDLYELSKMSLSFNPPEDVTLYVASSTPGMVAEIVAR
jgi:hypothetical protein